MGNDYFMFSRKCSKCGKEIYPTPQWVYREQSRYYCSWKCFNHRYPPKKRKIILPNVGDTIEILYAGSVQEWIGRKGVVQFYDCFGQMHGTWGKFVVIPGEDRYRIIGEKDDACETL